MLALPTMIPVPKKPLQRRHIEALVAVADHGSVHRAAISLGMPQPALSRLLAEAEDRLGARIFGRSVHGTTPTAQGEVVLAQARFTLRSIERLDRVIDPSRAAIKLGCIPRAMHSVMPHILNRMYARPVSDAGDEAADAAPQLFRLNVTEDSSTILFDQIRTEKLDFVILRHVADAAGIGHGFNVEKLYDERPMIVCRHDHPLFKSNTIRLEQLAEQEWILPSMDTTSREVLDKFWREQGLPQIKSVIETRTFESNLALVAETPFISIVPESLARRHERLKLIRILNVRPALPASAVMLVYNQSVKDDVLLESFRKLIHAAVRDAQTKILSTQQETD